MPEEQPMIVFFTCSKCQHCVNFRGSDGRPSDDKQWKSGYIRKLLTGTTGSTKNKKLLCSRIINVHDNTLGAKVENIDEFIIYCLIPSDIRVTEDLFKELMLDNVTIIGDSILRIAIKRKQDGTMKIIVEIDGNDSDERCEDIEKLVEEYYIWDHVPIEFYNLREHFRSNSKQNFEDIISDKFRNDPFYEVVKKEYKSFKENPELFESFTKYRFDYNWFLDTFFPTRIRELEAFYPTWMLILPTEWGNGIGGVNKVYAKVRIANTMLVGNRFVSRQAISNETMEDIIQRYYSDKLFLTYSEVLKNQNTTQNKKQVRFSVDTSVPNF